MIRQICSDYRLDSTRVYLTGFSNGAAITREVGTTRQEWFAGLFPWNGPVNPAAAGIIQPKPFAPAFSDSGYELPCFICVGDRDATTGPADREAELLPMLRANHCVSGQPDQIRTAANYYTPEHGYQSGNRFYTEIYCGPDGVERVAIRS